MGQKIKLGYKSYVLHSDVVMDPQSAFQIKGSTKISIDALSGGLDVTIEGKAALNTKIAREALGGKGIKLDFGLGGSINVKQSAKDYFTVKEDMFAGKGFIHIGVSSEQTGLNIETKTFVEFASSGTYYGFMSKNPNWAGKLQTEYEIKATKSDIEAFVREKSTVKGLVTKEDLKILGGDVPISTVPPQYFKEVDYRLRTTLAYMVDSCTDISNEQKDLYINELVGGRDNLISPPPIVDIQSYIDNARAGVN